MNISQSLLWVVLPYSSIAIFIMGMIWQYEDKENYEYIFKLKTIGCIVLAAFALGSGIFSVFTLGTEVNALNWFFNIFTLNPDVSQLEAAPIIFKLHLISLCLLFILLPFTKYVKLTNVIFSKKYVAVPLTFFFLGM